MWALAAAFPGFAVDFPYQTVLAGALIGGGLMLDLVSILSFRSAQTTVSPLAPERTSRLVTTGLYRYTRNPMYLGLLVILIGAGLLSGSLLAVAVLPGFVAYLTIFQIRPEERRLSALFGNEYERYRQEVRRWL